MGGGMAQVVEEERMITEIEGKGNMECGEGVK